MGGINFDGGGGGTGRGVEKNCRMGGAPPMLPPTMGNPEQEHNIL